MSGALLALRRLAPAEETVIPALAALVRDKSVDREVRLGAAYNLGELGSLAQSAIPDLEEAKSDNDLGAVAAEAIKKIQDQ